MKKVYTVLVTRTWKDYAEIEVEAESADEACDLAATASENLPLDRWETEQVDGTTEIVD
jgi:nicotinate-nucleotide pyrophosphorylase